jgi:hypothetical protein
MRTPLLSLLLLAPLFSGCVAAAAGVGAGVYISQDVADPSIYVVRVPHDVKTAWASAKATLSNSSPKPIETRDDVRTAIAEIDNAKVTVVVETFDLDQSSIRVSARKYGVANGELAGIVANKIVIDLDR